jgi:hypothetical protein
MWKVFYPHEPFALHSELWKEDPGFQHSAPESDVRGGGKLAIPQLLYFLEMYPQTAVKIARRQRALRENDINARSVQYDAEGPFSKCSNNLVAH